MGHLRQFQPQTQRHHRRWIPIACVLCLLLTTLAACGTRSASEAAGSTPTVDSYPTQASYPAPANSPPVYPAPEGTPIQPDYPAPGTPFTEQPSAAPTMNVEPVGTMAIPTFAPTATLAPPPTPTISLAQAMAQVGPHSILYTYGPYLMLGDVSSGRAFWVAPIDNDVCQLTGEGTMSYFRLTTLWSSDGRFMAITCAFWSAIENPRVITYLLDRTAGTIQQLRPTDAAQSILQPVAWAPGDDRLLIEENDLGYISTHRSIIDALTGVRTALLDTKGAYGVPAGPAPAVWSPDGRQIALFDGNVISIVQADGSGSQKLDELPPFLSLDILWSPDGRSLYFGVSNGAHASATSERLILATGQVELLPGTPAVAFSPDGKHYLAKSFTMPYDTDWAVWSVDGSQPLLGVTGTTAAWLPDGRLVATICGRMYSNSLPDVNSQNPAQIVIFTMDGAMQSIAKTDYCGGMSLSPDGTLIAVDGNRVIDLQGTVQDQIRSWFEGGISPSFNSWIPSR
jgi:hypothetical protein